MKVEYLDAINEHNDDLIRLYDFSATEALLLHNLIKENIIQNKEPLNLFTLKFIKSINCSLTLRISDTDKGISTSDNYNYYCDLTLAKYNEMLLIVEPFTKSSEAGRYSWLYDLDVQTEFLISPNGNW